MGKFKEFILTEEIGLANLGAKVDQLFHNKRFDSQIAGAYLSTDFTGSEQSPTMGLSGHSLHLPSTDMTLPSVIRQGRVVVLHSNKNPIYLRLSDGTEANFTYDEWRRIKGKPAVGKVMMITFQRHPDDLSKMHSKIEKATVLD